MKRFPVLRLWTGFTSSSARVLGVGLLREAPTSGVVVGGEATIWRSRSVPGWLSLAGVERRRKGAVFGGIGEQGALA